MQLAVKHRSGGGGASGGLESLFVPGGPIARIPAHGAKLLEEVLRWGILRMLGRSKQEAAAGGAGADPVLTDRRADFTDDHLKEMLRLGYAAAASGKPVPHLPSEGPAAVPGGRSLPWCTEEPLPPPVDLASLRSWLEVECSSGGGDSAGEAEDPTSSNSAGGVGGAGSQPSLTADGFWDGLLRQRWEQLQREEDEAAAQRVVRGQAVDPFADELDDGADDGAAPGDEDYRGGGAGGRGGGGMDGSYLAGRGLGPNAGGRAIKPAVMALAPMPIRGIPNNFGIPPGPQQQQQNLAGHKVMRGGGRGGAMGGRSGRGRRLDDDEGFSPEMERVGKRQKRRGGGQGAAGGQGGAGGQGMLEDGGGGGGGGVEVLPSPQRVREILIREVARMEVVKQALADPSTLEYGVATRATARMRLIAAGIEGVTQEGAGNIADMGHQVADILIMMRHEEVWTRRGRGGTFGLGLLDFPLINLDSLGD